jgi:16S rRNA (cytosine967-C5)-methyltransferase
MTSIRNLAVTALYKIFNKRIKPREAIDELSVDIDSRDRAFLMELVYGVLRYRDYLDWMLKPFLKKPSGLGFNTLNNLRTAVYQINYMRVPEWAAVNEAVSIEKINKGRVSLVNAVLRNFLRHRNEIIPPSDEDPIGYISITTSHPRWLVRRWIKRFGYDDALKLAEANNRIPPIILRAGDGKDREKILLKLAKKGIKAHPTEYSPAGIALDDSILTLNSELLTHNLYVQDEAAQLITYLLNPLQGERILDACAAPGGKTTHIAGLMKDKGEIVAVESDVKRIKKLEENISKSGVKSVRIIQGDITTLKDIGFFDKILLDAPCSSTGVIRRNPDVKYRHTAKDLLRYGEMQNGMLNAISQFLKPGGILVYSVCSTEPEEGEDVIKKFLHENHNFSIIEGDQFLEPWEFLNFFAIRDGHGNLFYRTFPHKHEMDGFFAARLKRLQ